MGRKVLCFGLTCILFSYYMYRPVPDNIEDKWKIEILDALIRTFTPVGLFLENIGVVRFERLLSMITEMDFTGPVSDENITVTDTTFSDIPVRLYLPKRKSESKRRAVIFIHGGAYIVGSYKQTCYDILNRMTANQLNAVVVGVDYRLAPQYQFPIALEDVFAAVEYFLHDEVLAKYRVDPTRICISGDSSGASIAAVVTQLMQNHPEFKRKIKAQALLYPVLQIIDLWTPSYQENAHGPMLSRDIGIKMGCLYVTTNKVCIEAMGLNQHMPDESRHLFKFINWTILLPEKFKKNHVYTEPILGRYGFIHSEIIDPRLSPLVVNDIQLQNLPLTYILTCEHDIVRDDGLMYATRLRNVGVQVAHDHMEDAIHGGLAYLGRIFNFYQATKLRDKYISWLDENI
ncbi:arylacetamide deacetylase-like 2 [Echinops telfairi]|uniref:Arylacetamide deacetylase-like 2 n=1 Tax=Echinops telfairi TaxID=9371 RepID=A0ABM0J6L3_ECHTE|nr:arylacetamide deacetylase-like 2 [Echinops telfairi]